MNAVPVPKYLRASLMRRIWRMLDQRHRRQLLLLQGVSLLMGLSTLGGIAAVFPFFAVLADPQRIVQMKGIAWLYSLGYLADTHSFLLVLGLGFVAAVLISSAINLAGFLAIDRFAQDLAANFHVALYDEYLHREYVFHARTNSATLFSRVIYDCRRLAVGIVHSALTFVTSALTCAFIALSALLVNPLLAAAAGALLGGGYCIAYLSVRGRLARNGREQTRNVVEQTRIANESFMAIKEILLLGKQKLFRDRFHASSMAIARNVASTTAIANSPRHVAEALGAAGLVGVAMWMAKGASHTVWIAQLSVLALAMYRLLPAMQLVFASLARLRADADAFKQIEADLKLGLVRDSAETRVVTSEGWRGLPRRGIELDSVSFRYAPDLPCVLQQVSMSIPAGAIVGLIGPNGSGKSTLAEVILGLLIPEKGSVKIDGVALDDETRTLWRSSVAYVPQNPLLLEASVAENVTLGEAASEIDAARLDTALRLAGVNTRFAASATGDGTSVGERGVRLSGGQRQKIALARAFYRGAGFLVLDEATSALDSASEQEIVAVLRGLRGACTTLVIAHRLSSLRECDVIYELNQGAIGAAGANGLLMSESERRRSAASGMT